MQRSTTDEKLIKFNISRERYKEQLIALCAAESLAISFYSCALALLYYMMNILLQMENGGGCCLRFIAK